MHSLGVFLVSDVVTILDFGCNIDLEILQDPIYWRQRILHKPEYTGGHYIHILCNSLRYGLALCHHARLSFVESQDGYQNKSFSRYPHRYGSQVSSFTSRFCRRRIQL